MKKFSRMKRCFYFLPLDCAAVAIDFSWKYSNPFHRYLWTNSNWSFPREKNIFPHIAVYCSLFVLDCDKSILLLAHELFSLKCPEQNGKHSLCNPNWKQHPQNLTRDEIFQDFPSHFVQNHFFLGCVLCSSFSLLVDYVSLSRIFGALVAKSKKLWKKRK